MDRTMRVVTIQDAERIRQIYAPYVEYGKQTFEVEVPSLEEMQNRVSQTMQNFPWIVICENDFILGFAYAHPFRERAGFKYSAESSIYLDSNHHKSGMGKQLYTALIDLLRLQGYRTLVATVSSPNRASEAFHEKMGFELQGRMPNIGYKFNEYVGLSYYVKQLLPYDAPLEKSPIPFSELEVDIIDSILV